jgi:hypothetical protein
MASREKNDWQWKLNLLFGCVLVGSSVSAFRHFGWKTPVIYGSFFGSSFLISGFVFSYFKN